MIINNKIERTRKICTDFTEREIHYLQRDYLGENPAIELEILRRLKERLNR